MTKILQLVSLCLCSLSLCYGHCGDCATGSKAAQKNCKCSEQCNSRTATLSGEKSTHKYAVTGMTCGGCSSSLTKKLSELTGVEVSMVCHETGCAELSHTTESNPETIIAAIEKAGYKVTGEQISLKVAGMTCGGCEAGLSSKVEALDGVLSVSKACHKTSSLVYTVALEACQTTIQKEIEKAGYKVLP